MPTRPAWCEPVNVGKQTMKKAIELNETFGKLLREQQTAIVRSAEALANELDRQGQHAQARHDELTKRSAENLKATLAALSDVRQKALQLAAQVRDGTDDGAKPREFPPTTQAFKSGGVVLRNGGEQHPLTDVNDDTVKRSA